MKLQVLLLILPGICFWISQVLLWALHHLINFHNPPPVAIQRRHLRVLPGNQDLDSDVSSAISKCYEMLTIFTKIHQTSSASQCSDGNPPCECPQPLHARQAESVLTSQLPAGAPISPNVQWYNPYTIHIQYESLWITWCLWAYVTTWIIFNMWYYVVLYQPVKPQVRPWSLQLGWGSEPACRLGVFNQHLTSKTPGFGKQHSGI